MPSEAKQRKLTEGNLTTPAVAEASRFCLWLIAIVASLALLWIAFSWFIVPAIIASAYRGESLPFFNEIISGQAINPVESYLAAWEIIRWRLLGMLLILGLIPVPLIVTRPEVQSYWEDRYGNVLVPKPLTMNAIMALLGLGLVLYLYYFHPVAYVYFITEDSWAEYAGFVSWAMTSCFVTWTLFKDRELRKAGSLFLVLATFFIAMEEISWGQRILGLPSPKVFAEYNLQGETNLHNLFVFPNSYIVGIVILIWSIFLPLLTRNWQRFRGWCDKLGVPIVPVHLWPYFVLAVVCSFSFSLFQTGEVGEVFLAVAIAILSVDLVLRTTRATHAQGITLIVATAAVILTVSIITAFLVHFYRGKKELGVRLNEFASTSFINAGMYRQAEVLFEYLSQHPEFLGPETRYRHGVLLVQMGHRQQAEKVLALALVDQERFYRIWPESAWPHRVAGQVLTLLGREEEAKHAFMKAIEKDRARLRSVTDSGAEAWIRWSLAMTLFALGDSTASSEQSWRARTLAPDRRTQLLINRWRQRNLGREAFLTTSRLSRVTSR